MYRAQFLITRAVYLLFSLIVLSPTLPTQAEEVWGFRRDGSGTYSIQNPPVRWTSDQNVIWKTELAAPSKSSPILVDDNIFVLAYPHSLICLRRADGEILWQKTHAYSDALPGAAAKEQDQRYPTKLLRDLYWPANDDLSQATPVSDGKTVYAVFGSGVVAAHSLDGTQQWIKFIERPTINYGHASSPVFVGGKLIVQLNDLVALDPKTGDELWRAKLPATHATPTTTKIGDTEVLVHPEGALVQVSDGQVLARDLFDCDRASPVVHDGVIYGHGEALFFAVSLPSDVNARPKQLWETKATAGGYTIASPVVYEGKLYGINRNGILEVVDLESGEIVHRERTSLGNKTHGGFATAGGLLYVGNEKGKSLVLRPGASLEQVGENELGEQIDASPVFADGRLYLRAEKHLYCIGNSN
jgi:outer membrane protein assembly factor BamB